MTLIDITITGDDCLADEEQLVLDALRHPFYYPLSGRSITRKDGMIVEEANPQHFERLKEIIQSGECVLFLGAGVSISSGAPSGGQLANELGTAFFQSSPDTFQLDGVCQLVDGTEGRKTLNDWLVNRFHSISPTGALLSIPHFKWRSIYTVNIDILVEEAYSHTPDRIQSVHPFYSDRDPLSRLRDGEVPLYKLHGCLSRPNADEGYLILTQEDFARVQDSRQRLFNRLIEDTSDFTVLYIGFRRADPDFSRMLLAVEKASGSLLGLRRSFALQPHFIEAEARTWAQKRVTLVGATADDFFGWLEKELPDAARFIPPSPAMRRQQSIPLLQRKPKITQEILAEIERNYEVIDERIEQQPANTDEFLLGGLPNWGTISRDVAARRDVKDTLLTSVLRDPHLDRGDIHFVLIHAEAGAGKSTLLRQVGVELALIWNQVVVALKSYGSLDFLDLERLARLAEERVSVLIDDATSEIRDLNDVLRNARQAKTKLTILASARTNEWREVQQEHSLPPSEEFELGVLSRPEINAVLDMLASHNSLGLLAGASRDAQVRAFEERAEKQLLVALREATEGKNFDEIVADEYDRIPSLDGQRAYLLVAALHRFGIPTRAGLLHRALGIPLSELAHRVFDPTLKVIVPRDALGEDGHYYSTRHQLIAGIVFDRKLPLERRKFDFYSDLIHQFDLGYSSDADAYRQLTRGKNKQLLRDFRDPQRQREVMQQLIGVDPTDAAAYQHAAMMELDLNSLDAAAGYLDRAIALRPGDFSIRDTEGLLALKLATMEQDINIADAKFARTEQIFLRNIQRRRDEPFGYRHLAETYASWAACQDRDSQRLHYIGLAYQALLEGLDRCLSAAMLLQYQGELEEKFGTPENARSAFAQALMQKPGDIVIRIMAARLEEREGDAPQALEILLQGLNMSRGRTDLHSRIALLMAMVQPDNDAAIRSHFDAAMLGPLRNYSPRLAYGAYLFSRKAYEKSREQFARLDELVVPNRERFEIRKYTYGALRERHKGRISRLSYSYSLVEFDQGAEQVYFPVRELPAEVSDVLSVGDVVSYEIGFNLRGPIAIAMQPCE